MINKPHGEDRAVSVCISKSKFLTFCPRRAWERTNNKAAFPTQIEEGAALKAL